MLYGITALFDRSDSLLTSLNVPATTTSSFGVNRGDYRSFEVADSLSELFITIGVFAVIL